MRKLVPTTDSERIFNLIRSVKSLRSPGRATHQNGATATPKSSPANATIAESNHNARLFYCFCGFASKKSFTIGTMMDIRSISMMCVVLGNMANLDADANIVRRKAVVFMFDF